MSTVDPRNDPKNVQLIANLEYIRKKLLNSLSQNDFADIIGVAPNTYWNYVNFNTKPETTMDTILNNLNEAPNKSQYKKRFSGYVVRFPNGITRQMLEDTDLSQMPLPSEQEKFYDKFWGVYLCYYNATNQATNQLNYGIIQIAESSDLQATLCSCKGIFSIKNLDDALQLAKAVKTTNTFPTSPNLTLFNGTLNISFSTISGYLYNTDRQESVALSFDFNSKVLTRHSKDEKDFIGGLGVITSQTRGTNSLSASFPMAIVKGQLTASDSEIINYLQFDYDEYDNLNLLTSAKNIVQLYESIISTNIPLADNAVLLVPFIQYELKKSLSQLSSLCYISPNRQSDFYQNILKEKIDI